MYSITQISTAISDELNLNQRDTLPCAKTLILLINKPPTQTRSGDTEVVEASQAAVCVALASAGSVTRVAVRATRYTNTYTLFTHQLHTCHTHPYTTLLYKYIISFSRPKSCVFSAFQQHTYFSRSYSGIVLSEFKKCVFKTTTLTCP